MLSTDDSQDARWDPDRAGVESASHEMISVVVAAQTAAMRHFTAVGDTPRVRALAQQRDATAQLRSSIVGLSTGELTALMRSLRATAEQLRADTV